MPWTSPEISGRNPGLVHPGDAKRPPDDTGPEPRNKPCLVPADAAGRNPNPAWIEPADDVATPLAWLRCDALAVAGPQHTTRQRLFDCIVTELRVREVRCRHRIKPVRTLLENQRDPRKTREGPPWNI